MVANSTSDSDAFDAEMFSLGAQLAGFHIEGGLRKFEDFARAMLDDLGEGARPFLRSWYEGVRHYPGFYNAGMTPAGAIGLEPTVHAKASQALAGKFDALTEMAEFTTFVVEGEPSVVIRVPDWVLEDMFDILRLMLPAEEQWSNCRIVLLGGMNGRWFGHPDHHRLISEFDPRTAVWSEWSVGA